MTQIHIVPCPGSDRRTKNQLFTHGPVLVLAEQRHAVPELGGKPGLRVRTPNGQWAGWFRTDWVRVSPA